MSNATKRWWLAINGQTDGPRTYAYIMAAVQSGQISPTTQACPEGGVEWRPLQAWPELASIAPVSAAPPPPMPGFGAAPPPPGVGHPSSYSSSSDGLLTNPHLPKMANWICIFTIVVLPFYWLYSFAASFVSISNPSPSDFDVAGFLLGICLSAPLQLAVTVALAIGGLRLRSLRASGPRLIRIGIWCDIVWVAVYIVLTVLIFIVMASGGASTESQYAPLETIVSFFGMILGGAVFAFEIVTLIWLTKHSNELPLDPST